MVLRDPPGGLSYATYENVMTTVTLNAIDKDGVVGNKFGLSVKSKLEFDAELCAGGGFGVMVLTCDEPAEADTQWNIFDASYEFGYNYYSEESSSQQFSTVWSYETSQDPWTAGAMSDVFVVPNLNVMYEETYDVKWDDLVCSVIENEDGTLPIDIAFDIKAPTSKPAISFYSRYHVEYVKLPELRETLTRGNMTETKKETIEAGIRGWETALTKEKDSFISSTSGDSKSINNWFTSYTEKEIPAIEETTHVYKANGRVVDSDFGSNIPMRISDRITRKGLVRLRINADSYDSNDKFFLEATMDKHYFSKATGELSACVRRLKSNSWEEEKVTWDNLDTEFDAEKCFPFNPPNSRSTIWDIKWDITDVLAGGNAEKSLLFMIKEGDVQDGSTYSVYIYRAKIIHKSNENLDLAPTELLAKKVRLGDSPLEKENNENIKRIQFSGGGNLFSMALSHEDLSEFLEGSKNIHDTELTIPQLDGLATKVFGTGLDLRFSLLNPRYHRERGAHTQTSNTNSTSIGFVLGDEDPGDEFVVDLFYDDIYKTIIFKTVNGRSKCPHEEDTAAIEDPNLQITRRPPQHVFANEDMTFELEMKNLGVGNESLFVLYAQHRDNDGGLSLILDGSTLVSSREFSNVKKDTTYTKILQVKRGPSLYKYPAIDLVLESSCEDGSSL